MAAAAEPIAAASQPQCWLRLVPRGPCAARHARRPQLRRWFAVSSPASSSRDCYLRRAAWAHGTCPGLAVAESVEWHFGLELPRTLRRPFSAHAGSHRPTFSRTASPPPRRALRMPLVALGVLSTISSFGCQHFLGRTRCRTVPAIAARRRQRLRAELRRSTPTTRRSVETVSYTHLTLPTIPLV